MLLAEWFEAIPDTITAADPWLALGDATARINSGSPHDDVGHWLERAAALPPQVDAADRVLFDTVFTLEAGPTAGWSAGTRTP